MFTLIFFAYFIKYQSDYLCSSLGFIAVGALSFFPDLSTHTLFLFWWTSCVHSKDNFLPLHNKIVSCLRWKWIQYIRHLSLTTTATTSLAVSSKRGNSSQDIRFLNWPCMAHAFWLQIYPRGHVFFLSFFLFPSPSNEVAMIPRRRLLLFYFLSDRQQSKPKSHFTCINTQWIIYKSQLFGIIYAKSVTQGIHKAFRMVNP